MARSRRPALVGEIDDGLERRIQALEAKRPLDLDRVEQAIRRIRRPETLAARLGDALRYSQRVEADVAGLSIETLLPHAVDDYDGRFLDVWVPDELGHAEAQGMLLHHLSLPPYDAAAAGAVPLHNRVVGALGRLSAHAYEMVSMAYHAIGAVNERLAVAAYAQMAAVAVESGEQEVARVLFDPMRRDESFHLGYYRTYARRLRTRLASWQLATVRALVVATYAPVGAGREADKAPFGRALIELEADPDNPAIAAAVHGIADELLARADTTLPPFVVTAMRGCVERARSQPTGRAEAPADRSPGRRAAA